MTKRQYSWLKGKVPNLELSGWDEAELNRALSTLGSHLLKTRGSIHGDSYAYAPTNRALTQWRASDGSEFGSTLFEIMFEYCFDPKMALYYLEPLVMEPDVKPNFIRSTPRGQAEFEGGESVDKNVKAQVDKLMDA